MNVIPFVLLAVSLSIIIFIIARRYTALLLLDLDSLPHVQEMRRKNMFIRKKAEQKSSYTYKHAQTMIKPFIHSLKVTQLRFRQLVGLVEKKARAYEKPHRKTVLEDRKNKLSAKQLVTEALHDLSQDDLPTAEKKFLAALKGDPKNIEAYKGLAEVYYKQGQKTEAEETYKFTLQLDNQDEEVYLRLGEIAEEEGKTDQAVEYYEQAVLINPHNPLRFVKLYDLLFDLKQYETALEAIRQALELEPQNPKYLDNFIEVSIMIERKDLAEDGYRQLRMINPENQKLEIFRQRIGEMK